MAACLKATSRSCSDDELLRGAQGLAQLLRRQRVDEFVGDHGA